VRDATEPARGEPALWIERGRRLSRTYPRGANASRAVAVRRKGQRPSFSILPRAKTKENASAMRRWGRVEIREMTTTESMLEHATTHTKYVVILYSGENTCQGAKYALHINTLLARIRTKRNNDRIRWQNMLGILVSMTTLKNATNILGKNDANSGQNGCRGPAHSRRIPAFPAGCVAGSPFAPLIGPCSRGHHRGTMHQRGL